MTLDDAARCLGELGNATRLEIFRLLVRAGHEGLSISEIRAKIDIPASTLAFHLRAMAGAGLVTQERRGREVRCRPDFARLNAVLAFVREECCQAARRRAA